MALCSAPVHSARRDFSLGEHFIIGCVAVMLHLSGGRDTFWILKGLLVSGMHQTAAGMVRNLVSLAAAHGHVPNGMRSYYMNRSQPPLLSVMVKLVVDATGDETADGRSIPGML